MVATLAALAAISAMSYVPEAKAEGSRLMLVASSFAIMWFLLGAWAGYGLRRVVPPYIPPKWLKVTVVSVGTIYVFAICLLTIG